MASPWIRITYNQANSFVYCILRKSIHSSVYLYTTVPPKVIIPKETLAVTLAQPVLLHCPIEAGDPPPKIFWMKDDRQIYEDERISQLKNGSLIIYGSTVSSVVYTYRINLIELVV